MPTYSLTYAQGTIILEKAEKDDILSAQCDFLKWDSRIGKWRGLGVDYGRIKSYFLKLGCSVDEQIGDVLWGKNLTSQWQPFELRPYQKNALTYWKIAQYRGIVSIPTGGGKTLVGVGAIRSLLVPTLVLVPTRILLYEWIRTIKRYYTGKVACYGDGSHEMEEITVATFAAAYLHAAKMGCRFKLLLIDEVHHFGCNKQDELLEMMPAPMRLGLTATFPEQAHNGQIGRTYQFRPGPNQGQVFPDSEGLKIKQCVLSPEPLRSTQDQCLHHLVGKKVFDIAIGDLVGKYLAPFRYIPVGVELGENESALYRHCYNRYHQFQKDFYHHYPQSSYKDFLVFAHKSPLGKEAIAAWVHLKNIINFCRPKEVALECLLQKHCQDKMLIFTGDTESAYQISRRFLLPIITSEIKKKERESVIEDFRAHRVRAVVSCRVLNEGVNIPDASIAVILGGTHGTREFIQRLGRVLRLKTQGLGCHNKTRSKLAIIYHIYVKKSIEENRRRLFQQVIFEQDHTQSTTGTFYDRVQQ